MDLEATPYRSFVAVAEERSFTRAATRLNLSQPALSSQIRELERRLGFALFVRTSRRVDLTVEGRLFLANARRMIVETTWINRAAQEIRTNQLRIGAPLYTLMIPERRRFVDRLIRDYPHIKARIFDKNPAKQYADLARREIDLALMVEPLGDGSPLLERSPDRDGPNGFEEMMLAQRRVSLLVPGEHDWAKLESIPLDALRNHKVAVINRAFGVSLSVPISRAFDEAGADLVRPPEAHAVAVERFGALARIPAVTLGWFDGPDAPDQHAMVRRQIDGLDLRTGLMLTRLRGEQRSAAETVWGMAKAFKAELASPEGCAAPLEARTDRPASQADR